MKYITTTKKDIQLAYDQSITSLTAYLDREVTRQRISPGAATAQVRALEEGKKILLLLEKYGITSEVLIGWLKIEMGECEKRAKEKEQQTAAAAA